MINKIKFTSGKIEECGDYFNLTLFNGDKTVYKCTLENNEAAAIINKYAPKIEMIRKAPFGLFYRVVYISVYNGNMIVSCEDAQGETCYRVLDSNFMEEVGNYIYCLTAAIESANEL